MWKPINCGFTDVKGNNIKKENLLEKFRQIST